MDANPDAPSVREKLRRTFDNAAEMYQDARPEYPEELFATLVSLTGIRPETSTLCEVGSASGKATLPLARRGFSVTCVELGAALAAQARRNLAEFDRVTVVNADFETWTPAERFDLVFAATAWHWIDPAVRYAKAAAVLRPGGYLAFWQAVHVIPDEAGDPFFREIQDVYDEIGEGLPGGWVNLTTEALPSLESEILATGLFADVTLSRFTWEISYDAEAYIRLLDTFSGHIAMADWQRERLYGEIRRRLADRPDGRLRRHWGGVLHVARRTSGDVRP